MEANNTLRNKQEEFITISDLWHLSVTHWRWFILSLVVMLGLAAYYLRTTEKMYTREAAILVKLETKGQNTTSKNGDEFNDIGLVQQSTNISNVQRHMLSLDVMMAVVEKLNLGKGKEVLPKAERILKRMNAKAEDDKSTIINIKYTDANPQRAEKILNTLVQVYNEKWLQEKNQIAANTSRFIDERLALLSKELGTVDDSISVFKSRNQITDLERVSDIYLEKQTRSEAEILSLNNQKAMAEYIRSILRGKSTTHQLLPTNSGINNTVAEAQISQYNAQLLQLNSHLAYTSDQNPLIGNMEKELTTLRNNILSTIDNQIQTLNIQLNTLYGYSGETQSKITSNPNQAKKLTSVQRQQKVKESLYLYLLQKKEENELSLTYTSYNTQLIDIPHGSNNPTSPNSRNIIFAAVFMALLIPVAILFLRENMDTTVRSRQDIERKTTLPLIGEIPFYSKEMDKPFASKPIGIFNRFKQPFRQYRTRPEVVAPDRQNLVNEAFRLIRTNIEFMTDEKSHTNNVYIVTSSYPGSGKTFISMNLSIVMALMGKRVLFIDSDLRHASASSAWNCKGCLGLSDYLSAKVDDISSVIVQHSEYPTLSIIPVGTIPPNPVELLSSNKLKSLIEQLRTEFDYIFIDCPPSENLADTAIIERIADRTLFVIRAGLFGRDKLEYLEEESRSGKYKHLSLILNCGKQNKRYQKYGYGYSYSNYN